MVANRILPVPTATSAPFWEGLRAHEIHIQQCADCGHWVFYPRSNCSACLSDRLECRVVSGAGAVYTFSIARVPTLVEFKAETPQLLVVVELDEGIRVNSVLVDVAPEDIRVGMRVRPVFVDVPDSEATLLHFAPAEA